jgi:hypothetical protein
MNSIIIRLLLFFYLSSSYLSATHIHHDTLKSLDKCKVHLIVKNLNSADVPHNALELISCLHCFYEISFNYATFIQAPHKGFNAQAPPLIS